MTITDSTSFIELGYVVFDQLLERDVVAAFRPIFDDIVRRQNPDEHWEFGHEGRLHKVQGVCVADPRVLELATQPAIVEIASDLLGAPELDFFGTKFFPKFGGGGESVQWHQDNAYFGTASERVLSCGIYLDASDVGNGCLRVIPGSHRGEIIDHFTNGMWASPDESDAVDVECGPGTVVFFSAKLLHSAHQNRSDRTRYSTAWHYIPSDLHLDHFPKGVYEDRHTIR